MSELGQQYINQISEMEKRAKVWLAEHPGADPRIQFNYPPNFSIVMPISDAFTMGVVTANTEGLELLKALWPWNDMMEPTPFMVQMALDRDPEKMKELGL